MYIIKKLLCLVIALWAITSISQAQMTVPILFDSISFRTKSSCWDLGNILIINENTTLVNFGYTTPIIIENKSGKIIKQLNDNQIVQALSKHLQKNYKGIYEVPPSEDWSSRFCTQNKFIFQKFYRIANQDMIGTEISCTVKSVQKKIEDSDMLDMVAFFDLDLNLIALYEREIYNETIITSSVGGWFGDDKNLYIKKAIPSKAAVEHDNFSNPFYGDFVHFKLQDGIFCRENDVKAIEMAERKCSYPGRNLSMLKYQEKYYINNGQKLVKVNQFDDEKGETQTMHISKDEFVPLLKAYKNGVCGIKVYLNYQGLCDNVRLFYADIRFRKMKIMKKYDINYFRVCDMEVFGDNIVLLLFDKNKHIFALDIVN